MKHLIGKQVWLMPTGNNGRYGNKLVKVEVVKVGRVNVTFVRDGWNREEMYRLDDRKYEGCFQLSNEHNGGWVVFESLEDFEAYKEILNLRHTIARHIRDEGLYSLTVESLRVINKLLGLDKQEEKWL